MRAWALFLGGLLIWAAHFFMLYAIASLFLSAITARVLTGVATVAAIGAEVWMLLWARARLRNERDGLDRWMAGLALIMAGLSLVAVVWQGMPALFA